MVERVKRTPRAAQHATGRSQREPEHDQVHAAPRRTRRRKATVVEDQFYIPLDEIPEGYSYEWKRYTVNGQEDPYYIAHMREQGWEPVDPKRHPNWVPPGYVQPHIIKGGQILMERPIELTEEARSEQKTLAKRQVREAEQRLGKNEPNEMARLRPTVSKEIGRMVPVVEE